MIIREATIEDVPKVLPYAREFYEGTGLSRFMPYDSDSAELSIGAMINDRNATIMLAENDGIILGGIGAVVVRNPYNYKCLSAYEAFWFITETGRGGSTALRLLATYEKWAKAHGANTIGMAAMAKMQHSRISELYVKRGYEALESQFIRRA